eukprot:TRINITY_DN4932_c3_g1_i2.p1 TRINITY_DN4932_c3_g1~~TRINITY_DN4932_c3_g1_i2.p1  ORF type:complete len:794 (-),score=202.89 TRINITY_DN4932_c3_g1_i2:215-2596(-)
MGGDGYAASLPQGGGYKVGGEDELPFPEGESTAAPSREWSSPAQASLASMLAPFLGALQLLHHLDKAVQWGEDNGAADIEEVEENWEDLADYLGLDAEERSRIVQTFEPLPMLDDLSSAASKEVFSSPTSSSCATALSREATFTFGPAASPYEMIEKLGQGATATVYRCARGSDQYAAKVIELKRLRMQPYFDEQLKRLNREVSLLLTLRHPKIVHLHDLVESDSRIIMVMELMQGGELFDAIVEKGRFPEPEARHVFVQIVDGLQYIHSKRVVHRDLKPENILIDHAKSKPGLLDIKLSDFGEAKLINDGYTRAMSAVGTAQYWAPEVTESPASCPDDISKGYDARADLWSLGVVLYVMLMGFYPWCPSSGGRGENFSFQGSEEAEWLVRGLIRCSPADRLSLENCLESDFLLEAASQMLSPEQGDDRRQVRLRLPSAPADVTSLKRDLATFSKKCWVAANLVWLDICVDLDGESRTEERMITAQEELRQIFAHHYFHVPLNVTPEAASEVDDENSTARDAEIDILATTYGFNYQVVNDWEWRIHVTEDIMIRFLLPPGYPRDAAPTVCLEYERGYVPGNWQDSLDAWEAGRLEMLCLKWSRSLKEALRARFFSFTGSWAQRQLARIEAGKTKVFPFTLSSFQRMMIHRLAEQLGWQSKSHDVAGASAPAPRRLRKQHSRADRGQAIAAAATTAAAAAAARDGSSSAALKTASSVDSQASLPRVDSGRPARQLHVFRPKEGGKGVRPHDVPLADFVPEPRDDQLGFSKSRWEKRSVAKADASSLQPGGALPA